MSIRNYFYKTLEATLLMGLLLILLTTGIVATIRYYFIPQLPSVERLKDVHLQVPLHVYTKDGAFIAEYGEQRRMPLAADEIPGLLIKAVLAAEDDRFHEHKGVDLKSLFRALISLLKTGEKRQGGSTITMQVARNFFLSHERTFTRKFNEILLALKIEGELSKEEILKLYLNKIFFGHRVYGVGAAAQVYYGKNIKDLTLAEWAMLAGLPKAPSTNNPLTNPTRALQRRNYVLERMHVLKYISQEDYEQATKAPLTARLHKLTPEVDVLYVAEMVRSFLRDKFGEKATYTKGYKVFTTIDSRLQKKANSALRKALFDYDKRHGFKKKNSGIIAHVSIPKNEPNLEEWAYKILQNYPIQGNLVPSLVLETRGKSIKAINEKAGQFKISWSGISWARRYIHDNRRGRYPKSANYLVEKGDIIMARPLIRQQIKVRKKTRTVYEDVSLPEVNPQHSSFKKIYWHLSQVPEIEGALVTLDPKDGTIVALAGGFDFYRSKFNRVTQALRQPGSTFKPFIYSAALSRGFSHASIINDAPIAFRVKGEMWRPHNYKKDEYYGKTTLRKALAYSHNVSSVRLLDKVGVEYTINHLTKFGLKEKKIPRNLTIALGTGEVTPLELASSFAVFANKGFRIKPYFIDRIEDVNGKVIFSANPLKICRKCPREILASEKEEQAEILIPYANCTQIPRYAPRVLRTHNALTITSMLQSTIEFGTGRRALSLKRNDIAGKTGTTDNQRDAWFAGYSPDLVTVVWVGFDQPRSLGNRETGARTALPMWIDFMKVALKGKSKKPLPRRYAYVAQKDDFHPKARFTKKRKVSKSSSSDSRHSSSKKSTVIPEQLF